MRIYCRGYVIIEECPVMECAVLGKRPERETLSYEDGPRAAMRWIDRDIIRLRAAPDGWPHPLPVSA